MIRVITKARLVASLILVSMSLLQVSKAENIVENSVTLETFLQEKEVQCLAKNIYFESRGEPKEGMVAVGIVTINRTDHPSYPDSICGVVNHKTKMSNGKTVCQFSWVCRKNNQPRKSDPLWEESVKIAKQLLTGKFDFWQAKYENAYSFHNTSVSPKWNLKKVARVGRHIFYR